MKSESVKLLGPAILFAMSLALSLSGCVTMTGTSGSQRLSRDQIVSVCALWRGVGWEDADTDETITEIKVNNAKRDTYCAGVK